MSKASSILYVVAATFLLLTESNHAYITKEKAEKKAKKEVAGRIEFNRTFTVFVFSLDQNEPSSYYVYFLDDKGVLKGRDRISAYGKDKPASWRVGTYANAGVFDTSFFDITNARDFFNENQKVKFYKGSLVIAGELEINAPQPCWRIIDVRGTEWYYTNTGKIFNAEKLRKQFIEQSSTIIRR